MPAIPQSRGRWCLPEGADPQESKMGNEKWRSHLRSSVCFEAPYPTFLRRMWGFQPFSLLLSVSAYRGYGQALGYFPVSLGFPFRLFLGRMEVCQCSLRKVAACSAGGLSLPLFTSPSCQHAFPLIPSSEGNRLSVVRFRMQS